MKTPQGILWLSIDDGSRDEETHLVLHKVTRSDTRLQSDQKRRVHPLLVRRQLVLHELFDGNHARPIAVLEFRDSISDSCFVRHVWCFKRWKDKLQRTNQRAFFF